MADKLNYGAVIHDAASAWMEKNSAHIREEIYKASAKAVADAAERSTMELGAALSVSITQWLDKNREDLIAAISGLTMQKMSGLPEK